MNNAPVVGFSMLSKVRKRKIVNKKLECRFVASYPSLSDLPRDQRPQIAFAGRSNVGKSTLLNCIAGRKKLAKVSGTPGKTRSLNFFLVNDKFYFVDLPGYGYAKVSKAMRAGWGKLIEDYLLKSDDLIGMIFLLDCRREPTTQDFQLLAWLSERKLPVIVVITKADKLNRDKVQRKVREAESLFGVSAVAFSSLSGLGKRELVTAIHDLVTNKR
ncbi:MAG: ribosome biogenesis GTP-binding protein YihA/YsxC [candidate division Zixibacteria bacterium]|nr:ribosome biogenesis GTP-binding protein YihA/YsxC [candidate division Zixibacteria bacterium]